MLLPRGSAAVRWPRSDREGRKLQSEERPVLCPSPRPPRAPANTLRSPLLRSLSPLGWQKPLTICKDIWTPSALLCADAPPATYRGAAGNSGAHRLEESSQGHPAPAPGTASLPFLLDLRLRRLFDLHLSWLLSPPDPLLVPNTDAMAETREVEPDRNPFLTSLTFPAPAAAAAAPAKGLRFCKPGSWLTF